MTPVKRVLIVAYHFPPAPVAAAQRPSYLARYLPEFGWQPTVLTHTYPSASGDPNVVRVKDALERPLWPGSIAGESKPARALVGFKDRLSGIVWFPDRAIGWLPAAIAKARRLRRQFDAVISTGPPHSIHLVAWAIAGRDLPWIADYRDLWFGNPYVHWGPTRSRLEFALERELLRRATAVTGVSDQLMAQHKLAFGSNGVAITNAYDPDEWLSLRNETPSEFSLCYAGVLYGGRRRLDTIFAAVAALRRAGDPAGEAARFDIYGSEGTLVRQIAANCGITDIVRIHGTVDRAAVLRAQRQAAVLLIPLSTDPGTSGELGSKIFECIGARRPVLAVGPRDSALARFMAQHDLGWFASDVQECAAAIRSTHARFTAGDFENALATADDIGSARDLARRFASVLDSAISQAAPAASRVVVESA